jgi:hypothetical protein
MTLDQRDHIVYGDGLNGLNGHMNTFLINKTNIDDNDVLN